MRVRSEDMPSTAPRVSPAAQIAARRTSRPARLAGGNIAAGVMLWLFGVPLWFIGARYTFDGWVYGLNLLLAWLRIPHAIPDMVWWLRLGLTLALGLAYSRVEIRLPNRGTPPGRWIVFILVIASDVGSTFGGVITPPADAWALTRWVAASLLISFGWALILTFSSERLIMWGYRELFG